MSNNIIPKMSEMTIVDYFASQALDSLIRIRNIRHHDETDAEFIANEAYSIAMSMFKAKYEAEGHYE